MVDVPADVGDEDVMDTSTEALRMNFVIVPLAGGMVGFGVVMLSEGSLSVMLDAVVALDAIGFDVMIGVLAGTFICVSPGIAVDVLADAGANRWAAAMTALEPTPTLRLSKEAFLFGWESCSC